MSGSMIPAISGRMFLAVFALAAVVIVAMSSGPFEAGEAASPGAAAGNRRPLSLRRPKTADIRREEHGRRDRLAEPLDGQNQPRPADASPALSGGCESSAGAPAAVRHWRLGGNRRASFTSGPVLHGRRSSLSAAVIPIPLTLGVSQTDEAPGEIRTAASRSARHAGGRAESRTQPDHGNRRVGPGRDGAAGGRIPEAVR